MDSVAIVALTGDIVQFIHIGIKVVNLCVETIQKGTTTVNEDYRKMNDQFSVVVTQLNSRGEVNDTQLECLCQKCLSESSQLEQILNRLRDEENKFKKFFATWYNERQITKLKKRLDELESRLHLFISLRVRDSVNTIMERTAAIENYSQLCNGRLEAHFNGISIAVSEISTKMSNLHRQLVENTATVEKNLNQIGATVNSIQQDNFVRSVQEQLEYPGLRSWYDNIDTAYPQTLEWLVDKTVNFGEENKPQCRKARNKFIAWLRKGQGIFHITGKPGSGKSTLMKFLCESPHARQHLDAWAGEKSLVIARSCIGNGKPVLSGQLAGIEHSLRGFIRGLLHSVLTQAPEFTLAMFPELSKPKPRPLTDNKIQEALAKLRKMSHFYDKHKLVIFIDGLDEFKGDPCQLRKDLMEWVSLMPADIKICVSSREEVQFDEQHRLSGTFRLQDVNCSDIFKFVHDRLNGHTCYRHWSNKDRLALEKDIASKAEGVFLWTHLVIGELERDIYGDASLDVLKSRVEELPGELPGLFRHIIALILDKRASPAIALIKMVLATCTPWPLSRFFFFAEYLRDPDFAYPPRLNTEVEEEGDLLVRLEKTKKSINLQSRGLLEVPERQVTRATTVAFAHRSIPEFLIQDPAFTQYQPFSKGGDALDALCQILLADLACRATYNRVQRRTLKVDCETMWPYPILDFFSCLTDLEFMTDVRNVHELLRALGEQDKTRRRPDRIAQFLIGVARAVEYTLPCPYNLRLVFKRKWPLSSTYPEGTYSAAPEYQEAGVSVEALFQILAAYSGITWPENLRFPECQDILEQTIPFDTLTYNAILAAKAQDPRVAWGLIGSLKTFLSRGLSLASPAHPGDEARLSHWECFLATALVDTYDFQKLRRLLPLFHLFLLCGGDARVNFKIRLEEQSSHAPSQSSSPRGALGLVTGASEESREKSFHPREPKADAALGALRERLGDAFSLEDVFRSLVPPEEAPTLHELVALRLAELSPREQASRTAGLKPRVERMLTLEAIEEAFRL